MADKILDRVSKLIALSSSPEVEEARSSALLACNMIREHNLIIGYTGDKRIDREGVAYRSKYPEPVTMAIAHRGKCRTCGKYIQVGDTVWYKKGAGVAHTACSYDSLYER